MTDLSPLNNKRAWFTAKELGYDYPEIKRIYIGVCGAPWDKDHSQVLGSVGFYKALFGHAHCCEDDKLRGSICLINEKALTFQDGVCLKHEYAHLISGIELSCKNRGQYKTDYQLQKYGHGPKWEAAMAALGEKPSQFLEVTVEEFKWILDASLTSYENGNQLRGVESPKVPSLELY